MLKNAVCGKSAELSPMMTPKREISSKAKTKRFSESDEPEKKSSFALVRSRIPESFVRLSQTF